MRACAVVLLPSVLASMAFAQGSFSQTDWSGGSGEPGPVADFGTTYYASSYISWEGIPGSILLRINRVPHMISDDMYGCHYAFPADMDGDGDLDVVASQTLSWERVMWFENDGAGGGWREHEIAWNHPYVQCAYPGDLDNDGDMDVVGANGVYGGLEWWRNEDGVGNTWQWFGIDDDFGAPDFACTADIDGDGRLEVVSPSGYSLNQIAWWDKDDFTPPSPPWIKHVIAYGCDADEIFVVDLDQDGDMDVISPKDGLCYHDNVDGVGLTWEETEILGADNSAEVLHAADVDSDGDLDVVACGLKDYNPNPDTRYVAWFENEGFCDSWETHWIYSNTWDVFFPLGVHAADLTQDGLVDIACAEGSENWDLTVWQNIDASQNLFARHVLETGPWFRDVNTADFDGDGKLDLLVAASSGGIPIRWYEIDPCGQGRLTSSILDAQGWCDWDSIGWTSVEPEGTDITFQIRGSNDPDEMGAWSDTLTEPGSLEGHLDSAYRYIQYRVHLQADPGTPSPYLEEVLLHFSSMGVEESERGEPLSLLISPNPFSESVEIEVAVFSEDVFVGVYDLSGRKLRELSPNESGLCEWDGRDWSGARVSAGCYLLWVVSSDGSAEERIVRI